MGAHLGLGRVEGEELICGLHCWRFAADGRMAFREVQMKGRARTWNLRETGGLILLEFGGERATPSAGEADFLWTTTAPIDVAAHWHALTTNAFDMPHLSTVHRRELAEPPQVTYRAGPTLRDVLRHAREWPQPQRSSDEMAVGQSDSGAHAMPRPS